MTLRQFCHRPKQEVRRFVGQPHELQGGVRSGLVEVRSPRLDLAPGVAQRQEPVRVEAFIVQRTVEALREGVVGRLSGPTEVKRDTVHVGPMVERPRDNLRTLAHLEATARFGQQVSMRRQ